MMYPHVIDTSMVFNTCGITGVKPSLSTSTKLCLKEDIQCNPDGHCPIKDATAAMKLVQMKLAKGKIKQWLKNCNIPNLKNI